MREAAYAEMARLQDRHWWYRGRRHIIASVVGGLGLPADARILEAGCGAGGNLAVLARFGQVSAFEPHAGVAAIAAGLGIGDVRAGTLPDGIPFVGPFDLVCAFDVIEHVEDDAAALRALAGLCTAAGRLVLTVPAFPWLWSDYDVHAGQYRRYTRTTLRDVAARSGLAVEHLSAFNSFLLPVVAGVRFVQKAMGRAGEAEEAMPSDFANHVLERILSAEAPLVAGRGLPAGVSLLAVLSKSHG